MDFDSACERDDEARFTRGVGRLLRPGKVEEKYMENGKSPEALRVLPSFGQ